MTNPVTPSVAYSSATRYHVSRAGYFFAGPGSPANRKYPLLDFEGNDSTGPDVGAPWSVYANLNLGTPVLGVTTYVVNAQAIAGAGNAPLNATNEQTLTKFAANNGGVVVVSDVARALTYVSSNSGDTTQTVTAYGYDQYGQPMTETVTLNGTSSVVGAKAFLYVWKVAVSAALTGNLSVGTSNVLGLPVALDPGSFDAAVKVVSGVQSADAGTLVFAVRTAASATSGDVYGTYTPAVTLNGADRIFVRCFPALGPNKNAVSTYGVAQF